MTKRCIIHFGLHKTGSSSIQRFLRHELRDERFYYPDSEQLPHLRDNCHNRPLCCAFQSHPEKYHSHAKEGASLSELRARGEWFKQQLSAGIGAENAKTLILSAEELSDFTAEEIGGLVRFLDSLSLDVSAIGYVRKYKQLQESRFQQALREPGPRGRLLPPEAPRFTIFPYRQKLEKFSEVLGSSAVRIKKFEAAALSDGGIIADFCRRVGIAQLPIFYGRANEGLSIDAVRLLYAYRKFHPGPVTGNAEGTIISRMVNKLSELKGERVTFHSSLLARSEDNWRADVNWISERMGEDMLGDLYGGDQQGCVRGEADLFVFSLPSLEWLASKAEVPLSTIRSGDPSLVAGAVGILKDHLSTEGNKTPQLGGGWFFG